MAKPNIEYHFNYQLPGIVIKETTPVQNPKNFSFQLQRKGRLKSKPVTIPRKAILEIDCDTVLTYLEDSVKDIKKTEGGNEKAIARQKAVQAIEDHINSVLTFQEVEIRISNYQNRPRQVYEIFAPLLRHVKSDNVSINFVTHPNDSVSDLAEVLLSHPKTLRVNGSGTKTPDKMEEFFIDEMERKFIDYLRKDNVFQKLYLIEEEHNPFYLNNAALIEIFTILRTHPTFNHLQFSYHRHIVGIEVGSALANLLRSKTLTTLDLNSSFLGDETGIKLANVLKTNTSLTTLNLRYTKLGNDAGIAFAEALETNNSLTTLNLVTNQLGPIAGIAFAKALKTNTCLTTLHLGYTQLGNDAGIAFSEALETNKTLTTLDLRENNFTDEVGIAFAQVLKTNTSLTTLYLKEDMFALATKIALAKAIYVRNKLTPDNQLEARIDSLPELTPAQKESADEEVQKILAAKKEEAPAPSAATAAATQVSGMEKLKDLNLGAGQ